jgi:hypothetical protein
MPNELRADGLLLGRARDIGQAIVTGRVIIGEREAKCRTQPGNRKQPTSCLAKTGLSPRNWLALGAADFCEPWLDPFIASFIADCLGVACHGLPLNQSEHPVRESEDRCARI